MALSTCRTLRFCVLSLWSPPSHQASGHATVVLILAGQLRPVCVLQKEQKRVSHSKSAFDLNKDWLLVRA